MMRWVVLAAAAGIATSIAAQTASPDIVVQGQRNRLSSWREADTAHVAVLSDGSEGELTRIALNLERLHFLLSGLLGRAGTPDDMVKLRITLIGDVAEFQAMDLRNRRWQQGPFNSAFDVSRYYDPREDGAVMATTRIDQRAVLERGHSLAELQGIALPGLTPSPTNPSAGGTMALLGLQSDADLIPRVNEVSMAMPYESLLYAGYAQHYLMTYFPAAYPRWYLDGFGQIFATMAVLPDGDVDYGRPPKGASDIIQHFGPFPIRDVLNDRYLDETPGRTRWTPVHAWMLTHFLFFSDTRRPQLRQYLLARARGASPEAALAAFGDLDALGRELRAYYRTRKTYLRVSVPAERLDKPTVRRLTEGEAAFVKGRLELGSRVEAGPADKEQAARARWLDRLRKDAGRFPRDVDAQLLVAEAECRSGNSGPCQTAASRALALKPGDARALTWSAAATEQAAIAGPPDVRAAALQAARITIGRANHADTEAVLPLIYYYRSYADAEQPAPALAVDGLAKALDAVPSAPVTRLMLGKAQAAAGQDDAARRTLRPLANGPYATPEQGEARAVLAQLGQ